MPTPWLSWPNRLASTRWSATSRASSSELPSARQIAMVKACSRSGLTRTSPTVLLPLGHAVSPPELSISARKVPRPLPCQPTPERPRNCGSNWARLEASKYRRPADPVVNRDGRTTCVRLFRLAWRGFSAAGAQPSRRWRRPCRRRSGRSRSSSSCGPASSTASPTAPIRRACCRPRSTPCASRRPTCGRPPSPPPTLARNDLADTRKLLAPLEVKPGTDQPAETDAVKAERERLTEQATISESRVKQCEVVIARADQLLERLTKLRGEVVLRTLLQRDASPLSRQRLEQARAAVRRARCRRSSAATAVWSRDGLRLAFGRAGSRRRWRCWAVAHDRAVVGWAAPCAAASAAARRPSPASATAPSPPPSTASGWCWCRSWPSG